MANLQTGFTTFLALPLSAGATTATLGTVPTATQGRLHLYDGSQEEWVSYTGVSGVTVTGLTRNLSQTADPATGGTGLTWIAGTPVDYVAMHDQIVDKTQNNTFAGTQTFTDIAFTGTTTPGLKVKSLTTAQRTATTPSNGTIVYDTDAGVHYQYIGGARSTFATGTTSNASTTVAGKVEIATQAEITAGTSTGGTGAILSVSPDTLKVVTDAILAPLYFGNGQDGDVTINSGTTTLSADMYYNNLTVTSPGVLNPNGYRVFVKGTFAGTGTVNRNGNAGSNGAVGVYNSNGGAGGAGGAALNAGNLGADLGGGGGGGGGWFSGPGVAGTAGTAANPSVSNINGVGGGAGQNSGGSNGGAGGAGGTTTRGSLYNTLIAGTTTRYNGASLNLYAYKGTGSAGGGGGGGIDFPTSGGYLNAGGGGGGGGGNGGVIVIACATWNFTGTITAVGGAGGAGGLGSSTGGNGGRGGGGGGGNGGVIFRVYRTLTNDCTKTLTGGSGGAGGTAGTTGNTGETISIVI